MSIRNGNPRQRLELVLSMCKECIPRLNNRFNCYYDQYNLYTKPCTKDDWLRCPYNKEAKSKHLNKG